MILDFGQDISEVWWEAALFPTLQQCRHNYIDTRWNSKMHFLSTEKVRDDGYGA